MLANPYFVALAIPLVLLLCGALLKKIVKGKGWRREDFYLGVELTLAALGSAMVYVNDIGSSARSVAPPGPETTYERLVATSSFMVVCLLLLFVILAFHQDWQGRAKQRTREAWILGGVCNFIGVGLFAAFILLVKGVQ